MNVRFTGRTRAETKRKALAFWVDNQDRLRLPMREFLARCVINAEGTAIVFVEPVEPARRWIAG